MTVFAETIVIEISIADDQLLVKRENGARGPSVRHTTIRGATTSACRGRLRASDTAWCHREVSNLIGPVVGTICLATRATSCPIPRRGFVGFAQQAEGGGRTRRVGQHKLDGAWSYTRSARAVTLCRLDAVRRVTTSQNGALPAEAATKRMMMVTAGR
jgi:hypothetical protein